MPTSMGTHYRAFAVDLDLSDQGSLAVGLRCRAKCAKLKAHFPEPPVQVHGLRTQWSLEPKVQRAGTLAHVPNCRGANYQSARSKAYSV